MKIGNSVVPRYASIFQYFKIGNSLHVTFFLLVSINPDIVTPQQKTLRFQNKRKHLNKRKLTYSRSQPILHRKLLTTIFYDLNGGIKVGFCLWRIRFLDIVNIKIPSHGFITINLYMDLWLNSSHYHEAPGQQELYFFCLSGHLVFLIHGCNSPHVAQKKHDAPGFLNLDPTPPIYLWQFMPKFISNKRYAQICNTSSWTIKKYKYPSLLFHTTHEILQQQKWFYIVFHTHMNQSC